MKKNLFLITGIITCIIAVLGIVFYVLDKSHPFGLCMGITCIGASVFLLLDPDNKNTKGIKPIGLLSIIAISIMLIIFMSSCSSRNGYGCHGNQSWNKMVRRINAP
jgi:uncharacterized membrane protein